MGKATTILVACLLLIFAAPAAAQLRNARQSIMALTEVNNSAPVTVQLANLGRKTGYLVVKTENETTEASLVVTVTIESPLGDILVCTSTAITTNTTTYILLGSTIAAAAPITDACDFPLGRTLNFIFTQSVADKDFDVTAEMQWVVH